MNYSDEHQNEQPQQGQSARIQTEIESTTMPKIEPAPAPEKKPEDMPETHDEPSFAGELVFVMTKTVFIALSLVALLVCILAVAMPLTSMRIFNSMGNSARAVDFGERYIARELRSYTDKDGRTAAYTDANDRFTVLSITPELTNDDFIEALYVCTRLSDKLMTESLKSGDVAAVEYYAERLEKYTRLYLSLNGLSAVSLKGDKKNIDEIGEVSRALQPVVYSYEHDIHVLNYKARSVLGKTGELTFNNRSVGLGVMSSVSRIDNLSNTKSDTLAGNVQLLDDFVDFAGQIGAYLDMQFVKLGVETDFSKRKTIVSGDNAINVPVLSESFVRHMYGGKLKGDEFSLFITPLHDATENTNGFTVFYNLLKCYTRYTQLAVETLPVDDNPELHQLYWLRVLSNTAQKLWYMEMLLYYSQSELGLNSTAILQEYNNHTCELYNFVENNGLVDMPVEKVMLSEVYAKKLAQYVANN